MALDRHDRAHEISAANQHNEAAVSDAGTARRRIVVFADGTGNAFSTQESNVWRLYEALDKTSPDQIAHYIPGVGTSQFRPYALLDGATGVGVPSNVRRLYEFLCWNYREGDQIYMFGFSRGSFTIRTLIGLMHHEGLVPAVVRGEPVSRAEMSRNVMAAWRHYRSKTAPWTRTLPTVWLARLTRNFALAVYRLFLGHQSYASVRAKMAEDRKVVPIRFAGLFDTVEAYGVPFEELRTVIDWAVWPISFRNKQLSDRVKRACHALALDDERVTFHPLRFDRSEPGETQRIDEVWFAGVHSDVGGGYPDDDLAQLPLVWMLDKAVAESCEAPAVNGAPVPTLRFQGASTTEFRKVASPLAACHDSRSGLSIFYRYGPRYIGEDDSDGGRPVIHHSVAEKMVFGSEAYAPKVLSASAGVSMPDGSIATIKGFSQKTGVAKSQSQEIAEHAVAVLRSPEAYIVSLVRDTIWWRRVAYFVLLAATAVVVSLPSTAAWFFVTAKTAAQRVAAPFGFLVNVTDRVDATDSTASAILDAFLGLPASFLPGYAKPYAGAVIDHPLTSLAVIGIAVIIYLWSGYLRDKISDLARQAWFPKKRSAALSAKMTSFKAKSALPADADAHQPTLVRFVRKSARINAASWFITDVVLMAVLTFLVVSKASVVFYEGHDDIFGHEPLCKPSLGARIQDDRIVKVSRSFSTNDPCWASGVLLQEGRHYKLWVEMEDSWFDQTIVSDIAGFHDVSLRHFFAFPLKRWMSAEFFQLIARIGSYGKLEWVLESATGDGPLALGADRKGAEIPSHLYEVPAFVEYLAQTGRSPKQFIDAIRVSDPIPEKDRAAAKNATSSYRLSRRFVSKFVAKGDGELFLYVNDAMFGWILFDVWQGFYRNNSGTAFVTIERVEEPPTPKPAENGATSSRESSH